MKRDKDDDKKLTMPLFPRVHVRDTEKGWPRAPPRNKMALYERCTVASRKFNHVTFHSGYEPAANSKFSVQQLPPVIPVRVSQEHNVQRSDATSAASSLWRESTGNDDGYDFSVLENSIAGVNHCASVAENCFAREDDEMGNFTEISSCLDDEIVPIKRSEEVIVLDNDEDDSNAGVSDVSMVDSVVGREISLDDVVGAIGQRRFWRAKHAISKQQRLFAKQVFELHRLVKVQRLIAESPHIVFDDGAIKVQSSPEEKLLEPGSVVKPHPRYDRFKGDLGKAEHDPRTESAENTLGRLPSLSQGLNCNLPLHTSKLLKNDSERRSLQQSSGHHWLIPMMSPSEGLIYKPYPAPPGFAPGYNGCGYFCNFPFPTNGLPATPPLPLSQQQGPYSLPVAHQMLGYFPPYSVPLAYSTTFPGGQMDQKRQCNRPSSVVQDQSSCTMLGQENVTVPQVTECVRLERRKQSEDASCRQSDRRDSDGIMTRQARRVIRAVPCNPRVASESAARIFRSIQEERTRV